MSLLHASIFLALLSSLVSLPSFCADVSDIYYGKENQIIHWQVELQELEKTERLLQASMGWIAHDFGFPDGFALFSGGLGMIFALKLKRDRCEPALSYLIPGGLSMALMTSVLYHHTLGQHEVYHLKKEQLKWVRKRINAIKKSYGLEHQ